MSNRSGKDKLRIQSPQMTEMTMSDNPAVDAVQQTQFKVKHNHGKRKKRKKSGDLRPSIKGNDETFASVD